MSLIIIYRVATCNILCDGILYVYPVYEKMQVYQGSKSIFWS